MITVIARKVRAVRPHRSTQKMASCIGHSLSFRERYFAVAWMKRSGIREDHDPFACLIGSEGAAAPVCPQNRAYGSVHGSSRKAYPLTHIRTLVSQ